MTDDLQRQIMTKY